MNGSLRKNFDSLQLLRGIAASAVVFFHGFGESSIFKYGEYGVDLFFVLSGFIIMYIHYADIGVKKALFPFLLKRFFRIFPVYWIVTLGYIALVIVFGHTLSGDYIFKSALLIPQDKMPIVGVAWTLEFEILFYLIFGLLLLNRNMFYAMFCVWGIAIISFAIYPFELPRMVGRIFNPLNLEFLFGCGIACIILKSRTNYGGLISCLGILSLIASIFLQQFGAFQIHRVLAWGIPFALLILGLIILENKRELRIPRIVIRLGDASYSIYLTHLITLLILESLFERTNLYEVYGRNGVLQFVFCVIALLFGFLFYSFVEKPLLKYVKVKIFNDHHLMNRIDKNRMSVPNTP